jgi:hypothetical protein
LAALLALLLISCVFLTGLTMLDAPRPKRHVKSPVQTFAEEQAAQKQQAQSPARAKRRGAAPNAAQVRQEDAASKAQRRHPPDRSARIVLPSKQLR